MYTFSYMWTEQMNFEQLKRERLGCLLDSKFLIQERKLKLHVLNINTAEQVFFRRKIFKIC